MYEGEDRRTESFLGSSISRQTSVAGEIITSRQAFITDGPPDTRERSDSTDYASQNEGNSVTHC